MTHSEVKTMLINRHENTKKHQEQFLEAFYKAVAEPLRYRVVLYTDIQDPLDKDRVIEILIDRCDGDGHLFRDGWRISDDVDGNYIYYSHLSEAQVIEKVNRFCEFNGLYDDMWPAVQMTGEEYKARRKASEPLSPAWYQVCDVKSFEY